MERNERCPVCGVGLYEGEYDGMWEHRRDCTNAAYVPEPVSLFEALRCVGFVFTDKDEEA